MAKKKDSPLTIAVAAILVTAFGLVYYGTQDSPTDLTVIARIETKTGPDAIPPNKTYTTVISKAPLLLLDADPADILETAGIKLTRYESYGEDHRTALVGDFIEGLRASVESGPGSAYLREFYSKAAPVLKPHILQMVITDNDGKAVFKTVPKGTYFVVGAVSPHIWNVKVTMPHPTLVLN